MKKQSEKYAHKKIKTAAGNGPFCFSLFKVQLKCYNLFSDEKLKSPAAVV